MSEGGGGALSGGSKSASNSGGALQASGGAIARGGASTGGSASGGKATGGSANGGKATGGSANGGKATGGSAGGPSSGGSSLGGTTNGGSTSSAGSSAESGIGGLAGSGGEAGAPGLCDQYVACGCGCCGGTKPAEVGRCYYPEAGDDLNDIIAADQSQQQNPNCASAGCALGVRHACCLRGSPDPVGSASYSAILASTALDRITILKSGSTRCGRMIFASPVAANSVYSALQLPSSWALESAYESLCSMSALPPPAIGAIGSLRLRAAGAGCVVDVHVTAFFARNGEIEAVPFDADGLTLDGVSPSLCRE